MPSYSLIDERSKDLQDRIAELTRRRKTYIHAVACVLAGILCTADKICLTNVSILPALNLTSPNNVRLYKKHH
ncbi:unnamed protein product [Callosobruchus maculatus]|uniref:Uncharacterized protein n=1 Tax=Callosobruchus maculatus TaxID=64391 RepID=A0A653D9F9_CALMS|nr:unnamed protein product [Callosobruchus maculatus]